MTKKKPSLSIRQAFLLGSKLVISLSAIFCIFLFFRLNSQSHSPVLVRKHHRVLKHFDGPSKIAFLFLARKDLPLDFLWDSFFETADSANFSIYIHSEPGFVFNELTTRSSFFYNRQLSRTVKVAWGESSMIEAERLLLGEALEDPANQRFVLVSDRMFDLKSARITISVTKKAMEERRETKVVGFGMLGYPLIHFCAFLKFLSW